MLKILLELLVLTCVLSSGLAQATTLYHFIYTGQTGAQTQIDQNHASTWNFNINAGTANSFDLGGAKLDMKDGPQTTSDVSLKVWLGAAGTGTLLHTVTLTNEQFAANHTPSNQPQQFGQTVFAFSSPVTLSAPGSYTVQLTSTAPDAQAQAYFIKGGGVGTFQDSEGNSPPVTITGGQQEGGVTAVPEPSTWALTAFAGLGLAWIQRRRRTGSDANRGL